MPSSPRGGSLASLDARQQRSSQSWPKESSAEAAVLRSAMVASIELTSKL